MSETVRSHFRYRPESAMGTPQAVSMSDACESVDARLAVNAIEQVAFELRTANLIEYAAILADSPHPPVHMDQVRRELAIRLGAARYKEPEEADQ